MAVIRKSAEEAIKEKFAMKIGMDRTYFASVELGKRNVSIVNIEKNSQRIGRFAIRAFSKHIMSVL